MQTTKIANNTKLNIKKIKTKLSQLSKHNKQIKYNKSNERLYNKAAIEHKANCLTAKYSALTEIENHYELKNNSNYYDLIAKKEQCVYDFYKAMYLLDPNSDQIDPTIKHYKKLFIDLDAQITNEIWNWKVQPKMLANLKYLKSLNISKDKSYDENFEKALNI